MPIRYTEASVRGTMDERRAAKDELGKALRKVRELEEVIVDLWVELHRPNRDGLHKSYYGD